MNDKIVIRIVVTFAIFCALFIWLMGLSELLTAIVYDQLTTITAHESSAAPSNYDVLMSENTWIARLLSAIPLVLFSFGLTLITETVARSIRPYLYKKDNV